MLGAMETVFKQPSFPDQAVLQKYFKEEIVMFCGTAGWVGGMLSTDINTERERSHCLRHSASLMLRVVQL